MKYPDPFIIERADPYVCKGPDSMYYFTASYPARGNAENGYDRIILRQSSTVSGLACAEEKTIWKAPESGICSRHIWAPEIHFIGGRIYIFFAAGNSDDVWHIRPYIISCKGNDPMKDEWNEPKRMMASTCDKSSFTSFSLDMTYFEHNDKHYLIWAEITGNSSLYMAEISPENPGILTSEPILLSKPEYDWECIRFKVNEGASVLKTSDKIFVFFSASGTGEEYCMGLLWADINSDLMNPESWHKLNKPIFSTADLDKAAGPGHNSFVTDESGDILAVYHARPDSHAEGKCGSFTDDPLYDPCRHARIAYVEFDENGMPIIKRNKADTEIFDIVDEFGNPTGEKVDRNTAHKKGIRHRTAHIWITRKINGRVQVLMQKRAACKESFPGRYDTSCAGHIQAGDEPLESAIRELGEELGINAKPEDFKFVDTFKIDYAKQFNGKMFCDSEIAFVFIYRGNVDIQSLTLQEEEVECVEWFDFEEMYKAKLGGEHKFCAPIDGIKVLINNIDKQI